MSEEFEFQDLSDATFWGVDLSRATFRDVDLTGARISHARLVDVDVDAEIERLVVNGVDVTAYVNERDPWFALRSLLRPTDAASMQRGCRAFSEAWDATIEHAGTLPDDMRHASVDGEWSFVETLRHLVFAIDKWFTVPVLGGTFHATGKPNSGSTDFGWPDVDLGAAPTFEEAVTTWRSRFAAVGDYVDAVDATALTDDVEVLENGQATVHDCIGVVFEEHFQHLRYARRDLARLG